MPMRKQARGLALLVAAALAASVAASACAGQAAPAAGAKGDVAAGQAAFTAKGCVACHGANAEGRVGPKIAGTSLSQSAVASTVRSGKSGGAMPAFDASRVSDEDVANIYAWLQSKK